MRLREKIWLPVVAVVIGVLLGSSGGMTAGLALGQSVSGGDDVAAPSDGAGISAPPQTAVSGYLADGLYGRALSQRKQSIATTAELTNADIAGEPRYSSSRADGVMGFVQWSTEIPAVLVVRTSVDIDIKPGSDPNSINPKSKGNIPVAILSTADLDAPTEVDKASLTFGSTGDEESLAKCPKSNEDVNGDGRLDLVCHFSTQETGFDLGDTEGILRGQTVDGALIEGRDSVRIVN